MNQKFTSILTAIFGIKIIYNLYYFLIVKMYYSEYKNYVGGNKSWFIKEHKQNIIKIFKKAGIEDSHQPSTEPTGYGMLATGNFSVFQNMHVKRKDIVIITNGNFREAEGVYKQRIFETFNPVFWFEFFLQIPMLITKYLGFKTSNFIARVFQLLWWIIVAISTLVGIFFNNEFKQWLNYTLMNK